MNEHEFTFNPEQLVLTTQKPDDYETLQEAVILLLQDLRARKNPNTNKGSRYWRDATSLLDRLGAPYTPEVDTDKAEAESTRQEARDAFRGMFADTYEALDDLVYRPKEPSKDWRAEAVTLQARLTRAEESCDRIAGDRDRFAERVKYLESECDRIQAYCDDLMKTNIRLMGEKNKATVERIHAAAERIEGVA